VASSAPHPCCSACRWSPFATSIETVAGLLLPMQYHWCASAASRAICPQLCEKWPLEEHSSSHAASINGAFFVSFNPAAIRIAITTFTLWAIVPQFIKMFRDFRIPLPLLTQAFIGCANFFISTGLGMLLLLLIIVGFLYAWLRSLGVVQWNLPGMGRLLRRWDGAVVLDALSLVTRQGQSLSSGLDALAESYPNRNIRRRLRKTIGDIARGLDWTSSLFSRGLIGRADSAVLQAAQRVGNLPWALEEMADSNRRRLAYRVQVLLQTVFPLVIILYGILTMFVVTALFICLPALIEQLV